MNSRRTLAVALIAALSSSSCELEARPPEPAPRFCEIGTLILPGEYAGELEIRDPNGGNEQYVRLLAPDTICFLHAPDPPTSDTIPDASRIFPDSSVVRPTRSAGSA